jgi:hypothetical protein
LEGGWLEGELLMADGITWKKSKVNFKDHIHVDEKGEVVVVSYCSITISASKLWKTQIESSESHTETHTESHTHVEEHTEVSFTKTCTKVEIDEKATLTAHYDVVSGSTKTVSIPLNLCLANINGTLVFGKTGGFLETSRNVRITENGEVLECEVTIDDGKTWKHSMIRLSEYIFMKAGKLQVVGLLFSNYLNLN